MRVIAVVQARLGSTRLPGKALLDVEGAPMLARVLARASAVPGVAQVVLATTVAAEDDALAAVARAAGVPCVRGSVDDVLDRFCAALDAHPADAVARITADCPLLDPAVSGRVVAQHAASHADYASNVHPPTFPDGLDTEVVSAAALRRARREARRRSDREHVTPYVWRRPQAFRLANVAHAEDLSALRWTVDDARDLAFVRAVYRALLAAHGPLFGLDAVLALLRARPDLAALNAGTRRNESFERAVAAETPAP